MKLQSAVPAAALVASAFAGKPAHHNDRPCLEVPACPQVGTATYSKSVPDLKKFPKTQIDACYTDTSLSLKFIAHEEVNFYFNASQGTNDAIYEYEVMEAFIYKGTDDPQTYLEFEVSPNNVTYQAFVYNPSKVRAEGAPFDHFYIEDPATDGFTATTQLNRKKKKWTSKVEIPLGLFNVDEGRAKGTQWRMNFFRTVVDPDTFPDQFLGAWNPPDEANFHITKFLGNVNFV